MGVFNRIQVGGGCGWHGNTHSKGKLVTATVCGSWQYHQGQSDELVNKFPCKIAIQLSGKCVSKRPYGPQIVYLVALEKLFNLKFLKQKES